VKILEPEGGDYTARLRSVSIDYISQDITKDVIEAGVYIRVYDYQDWDYDDSELLDFITDRFLECGLEVDEIEVEQISNLCDIEEVIENYRNVAKHEDRQFDAYKESDSYGKSLDVDGIDDLFDRS